MNRSQRITLNIDSAIYNDHSWKINLNCRWSWTFRIFILPLKTKQTKIKKVNKKEHTKPDFPFALAAAALCWIFFKTTSFTDWNKVSILFNKPKQEFLWHPFCCTVAIINWSLLKWARILQSGSPFKQCGVKAALPVILFTVARIRWKKL